MIVDGVRKLASIRTISAINDIENAELKKNVARISLMDIKKSTKMLFLPSH
jgi:hypothetical protein